VIVFALDPALFSAPSMELALRGWAIQPGRTFRRIVWCNILPLPYFANKAVKDLNHALTTTPGPKTVFGWSAGARIANKWQREFGPTSPIPPEDLQFINIGDPENRFGGACVVPNPPKKLFGMIRPKADYGGPGIPEDTRYHTIVLTRQYDGWADCPNAEQPSAEALAAPDDGIHMNYFDVGLDDDDLLRYTIGNVTYLLKPTGHKNQRTIERSFRRPGYTRRKTP
jgi:hypothetical protein